MVDFDKQADEIGFFQDIVIEVGKQYTLSFVYGPRAQSSVNSDNLLSVAFGNLYEEFDAGNSVDGWQRFTQTITATHTTTRLKFLSLGQCDTLGANVDDVSVEMAAVSEPAFLLGLLVVGAVAAASGHHRLTRHRSRPLTLMVSFFVRLHHQ
ncbi:MAG: hypothetical protein AAF773_05300 [Cyanobacteria bacterium P01_D01_bin.115]